MEREYPEETQAAVTDERRAFPRVRGPFEGRRVGALETPVRVYDLNERGCFINSMDVQQVGVSIRLKVDLPHAGWITLRARTLLRQHPYGFAVCFVDVPEETAKHLHEALEQLRNEPEDQ